MSGTKRKHDDIVPEGAQKNAKTAASENDEAPHLPSDVLARVLDFLPFSDVRSAVRAGKHIAVHAAGHIETLNIMESSELNVRVAGRYPNVKEVNIGCILVNRTLSSPATADYMYVELEVSSDAVARIVPFLSFFPRLKRTSIYDGDYYKWGPPSKRYYSRQCRAQRGKHRENDTMMKSLVLSFCGGFDSGLLPQHLEIDGIINTRNSSYKCDLVPGGSTESCKVCRAVLKSFPLNIIKHLKCGGGVGAGHYCVDLEERLQIMKRREDWGEYLSQPCEIVLNMLNYSQNYVYFEEYFALNEEETEKVKLLKTTNPFVYVISEEVRRLIERVFEFGIRPELLQFLDRVAKCNIMSLIEGFKFLMGKETYDWMLSTGFQLDNNIFFPVRKDDHHVLQDKYLVLEELSS